MINIKSTVSFADKKMAFFYCVKLKEVVSQYQSVLDQYPDHDQDVCGGDIQNGMRVRIGRNSLGQA